jgi:hypothetical protein
MLWLLWRWFENDPAVSIFGPLRSTRPNPERRIANVAWDIYHMSQQPAMLPTSRKGADVLVPGLLTADRDLQKLWEAYPIRIAWIEPGFEQPFTVPDINTQRVLSRLAKVDRQFATDFLSEGARRRRIERRSHAAPPPLEELIEQLEGRLNGS